MIFWAYTFSARVSTMCKRPFLKDFWPLSKLVRLFLIQTRRLLAFVDDGTILYIGAFLRGKTPWTTCCESHHIILSRQLKLFSTRTFLRVTHPWRKEALRLLVNYYNYSKTLWEERVKHFKTRLLDRGYSENFIREALSEVHILKTEN